MKISQRRLVEDLLVKFGMADGNPRDVPMTPGVKLSKTDGEPLDQSSYGYSELIGSLMYLSVCTRPDIAQAVGALARFMSCPTTTHWAAAKGVLRYLSGTRLDGINYQGREAEIVGYCDSDFAGDIDKRRSTTGYVYVMNQGAISWSSRLQVTVAASTAEAEYMAAAAATKEALWLRKLFIELGYTAYQFNPVVVFTDNQAALTLIKHPVTSQRSKHIDVMYHLSRERVERGELKFEYISTDENAADIFTKALPKSKVTKCKTMIGIY
jgi:hypothetical protein